MNRPVISKPFTPLAKMMAALYVGSLLISGVQAQPTLTVTNGPVTNGRYLLIFDTSSAMKKRVQGARNAVDRLFFSMMNGQLRPGDTIGVWAFNRKLNAGKFPLQHWVPQNAAAIASNITTFIKAQRYRSSTRFDVIIPDVNNLVRSSERLTVLIFCDGEEKIKGTPFDDAINAIFKRNERELKKADQAFIVVLRSQLGQYVGYTVNSSGIGVNFPQFPPLPPPPKPVPVAPAETNPPPPPPAPPRPVIEAPPLVIVGTHVGTNLIPAVALESEPKLAPTNPPPEKVESNPPPSAESELSSTSTNSSPPNQAETLTNLVSAAAPETQTNVAASSEDGSGLNRKAALAVGVVLLVAAGGLMIFALRRLRKAGRGSLITRSMKKD